MTAPALALVSGKTRAVLRRPGAGAATPSDGHVQTFPGRSQASPRPRRKSSYINVNKRSARNQKAGKQRDTPGKALAVDVLVGRVRSFALRPQTVESRHTQSGGEVA